MKKKSLEQQSLTYHAEGRPGKITVSSHKRCETEFDLSLAYSPGVAGPCREISKNPKKVYDYTSKGNLVAVISNGTAILGLGSLGPLSSKPVMEGKGVLFKQFADIDVFDLELDTSDVEQFVQVVKTLEPTFGGINLEDIKSPECFEIEKQLKKALNIPVFHDDQHGTAIITAAAFINACFLTKRTLRSTKVVFNGAGAASLACAKLLIRMGLKRSNMIVCDSKGVIYKGRKHGMNIYKEKFANNTKKRTLKEALKNADAFIGLSVEGAMTAPMLKSMKKSPIVFAMANPNPEIAPALAHKTRKDLILATGRTDFPNQANNALGFPGIFRGALDVQATCINEEMKIAAAKALAKLAREDVPESVSEAYDDQQFHFGPNYILPKPFDPRITKAIATAVAKAAMTSKVARKPIKNFKAYEEKLESIEGLKKGFIRKIINQIQKNASRTNQRPTIVFPEGDCHQVLKAIHQALQENIINPVLIGEKTRVKKAIQSLDFEKAFKKVTIITPREYKSYKRLAQAFFKKRQRKGVSLKEAERLMINPYYLSAMMVQSHEADGVVSGARQNYADCVRPILEVIELGQNKVASGLNILLFKEKVLFCADTTMNRDPTAEQLASIATHAAKVARFFGHEPRVAMLSYSNFTGASKSPKKMVEACKILKKQRPDIIVDGEVQADTAVNPKIIQRIFPFSSLKEGANILVFPNLDSGNIAYKLLQQLSDGEVLGPFLMGFKKPANVVQRTGTITDIFNTICMTVLASQVMTKIKKL